LFSFKTIPPNAPPAAAVRDLLVASFPYLHRLQVWLMPTSGNCPHCSADGSLAAGTISSVLIFFSIYYNSPKDIQSDCTYMEYYDNPLLLSK
jgi:hypothetical protein